MASEALRRLGHDRRDQAYDLLRLNPDVDKVYLERRIREESFGDYGIDDIKG